MFEKYLLGLLVLDTGPYFVLQGDECVRHCRTLACKHRALL